MEKKCPHCQQWTPWLGKLTDKCKSCNELLEERIVLEYQAWRKRDEEYKKSDFFTPKETDGPLMLATRKVAFVFHMIFGAIAWLFIWSFASTPG